MVTHQWWWTRTGGVLMTRAHAIRVGTRAYTREGGTRRGAQRAGRLSATRER